MSRHTVYRCVINFEKDARIFGVHMRHTDRFPLPSHFITTSERLLQEIRDHRSFPIVQFAWRHDGFPKFTRPAGWIRFPCRHPLLLPFFHDSHFVTSGSAIIS